MLSSGDSMRATSCVLIAALMMSLAGCGAAVDGVNLYTSSTNRSSLNKLEVGMSREQVLAIMGDPYKREAVGRNEFLLYRTETYGNDDSTYTPIVLVNGRVTGWGRNFYDDVRRAELTIKQR